MFVFTMMYVGSIYTVGPSPAELVSDMGPSLQPGGPEIGKDVTTACRVNSAAGGFRRNLYRLDIGMII